MTPGKINDDMLLVDNENIAANIHSAECLEFLLN